jgi:hypothetical protein
LTIGITFSAIARMDALHLFAPGMRILDIGSSNLYSASEEQIEGFIRKFAPDRAEWIQAFARHLAEGSAYDPVRGGLNGSFVGELFEKAGMEYLSFDIADGYRTRILDLNKADLPEELCDHYDLVLNYGTTEHILNQFNSFKVMHDAMKRGAFVVHQLPSLGWVDHGYLTYTCKCFFDLASYNGYEIVAFWFDGPGGRNDPLLGLRKYAEHFPAARRALDALDGTPQGAALAALHVPDLSINIVCRKVKGQPFWGALESSTSVGRIPSDVLADYAGKVPSVRGALPRAQSRLAYSIAEALRFSPLLYGFARKVYRAARRR